jgi:hypothetical protein
MEHIKHKSRLKRRFFFWGGGENVTRLEELKTIFQNVEEDQRRLVDRLLEEVVFLENQMTELKKLPFVRVHPSNPEIQKTTSAAKLYKECTQSYMNAIRILAGILHKVESSAQDELLKKLEEFT